GRNKGNDAILPRAFTSVAAGLSRRIVEILRKFSDKRPAVDTDRFYHRSVAIIVKSAAARATKQMSHAGVGWNGEIFPYCHCRGSDCPYWDICVRSNSPLDHDSISGMAS